MSNPFEHVTLESLRAMSLQERAALKQAWLDAPPTQSKPLVRTRSPGDFIYLPGSLATVQREENGRGHGEANPKPLRSGNRLLKEHDADEHGEDDA